MPVIVIIVLIVLALIILRFVFVVIGILLITVLLGGVAAIVGIVMAGVAMIVAWLGVSRFLLLRLTSPSGTGAIYLSQENGQLVWTVNRLEVERHFPGIAGLWIALVAGAAGTAVVLVNFGVQGIFGRVEVLEVVAPPDWTAGIAATVAFVVMAAVVWFFLDPTRRFQKALLRAAERRIAQANGVCAAALTELREVEAEIESIGEAIGVRIAADYGPALQEALMQSPAATLQSLDPYVQAVAAVKDHATRDKEELVRAITAYQDADAVFHEAEAAVRTTGSAVLLSRLDELHSGLYGEELSALLMVRQWGDFGNVVAGIRGELEGLASDAAGFAAPGGSRRSAGGQGKRQGGRAAGRMMAAEAFRILGVPPTADAAKIKQVYRALAMAWHADTSGLGNDDRMKELNAAYACLQQAGHA